MSDIPVNTCKNCGHAKQAASDVFCLRYPPQVFPVPSQGGGLQPRSYFPPVMPTWHCGEWKSKIYLAGAMPLPSDN